MKQLFISIFLFLITTSLFSQSSFTKAVSLENEIQKDLNTNLKKEFLKKSKLEIINFLKQKNTPSALNKMLIKKYYKNYKYKTFFINEEGISNIAYELLEKIQNDPVLKPIKKDLFNINKILSQIELILSKNKDIKELVKLDFMLIGTYHSYMKTLARGAINWKAFQEKLKTINEEQEIFANWQKYTALKNIRKLLYKAVKNNDINLAIKEVNYTFPKAKELSKTIIKLEEIAKNGGYTKIPKLNRTLRKNNIYAQVKHLRQRLIQSNDLKKNICENLHQDEEIVIFENQVTANISTNTINKVSCEEYYDNELYKAVKAFQKRHGLKADGIVGKRTIKQLNTPIKKRIETVRINLERMRWMPRTLGEKHLLINIPEFNLRYLKNQEVKLQMPVIVGEKKYPTPIFSHKISSIVLNPYWRIPQGIVKNEIIPKLVKDPSYLEKEDIKIFENWDHESTRYDTSEVDWSMYLNNDLIGTAKEAPMRFIQTPGNKNPLGKMKFMFPNRYSVYLHDTPFKELFNNRIRAFSHGCIRLSKPYKLLETIVKEESVFTYEQSQEILKDIERTDIDLSKKIPVHIIYLTSWIDENGVLQFRDDIYNYDEIQKKFIYERASL